MRELLRFFRKEKWKVSGDSWNSVSKVKKYRMGSPAAHICSN